MPDIKEKLVELLLSAEELASKNGFFNSHHSEPKAELVADHLIANGVTVQKWISVEERLPEGECIAISMVHGQRAYGEMLIGYIGDSEYSSTGYAANSKGEYLDEVTHWMSLPEPPKGDVEK